MAYALAGIPLMLLYMASVGDILASAFRYAYFNFLCRGAGRRRKLPRRSVSSRRGRSAVDSTDSDSDFAEGGGSVAYEVGPEASEGVSIRSVARRRGGSGRSSSFKREGEKQIPVWACLSVIAGFVAGGATLFSAWEGWPLLDAAYFCVVSLVTVGFGDLVPGDAFRGAETAEGGAVPKAPDHGTPAATGVGAKEALGSAPATVVDPTQETSGAARRLLEADDYLDIYDEYLDLTSTSAPSTTPADEDLTPAFGGVFSDYVTTKDMMMVDGKLTFCALYLLTGMALLAMNFHLMQETGLRAARRMLGRLKPSWGQSKGGGRERSSPACGGAAFHPDEAHPWARGDAWRRRTWAGEGRRYTRGREDLSGGRRGSWAEAGTEQWESGTEDDGLDEVTSSKTKGGGGSNGAGGGGVLITLQAEDGAVYDWEPGGEDSSYAVSMEDEMGLDEGEDVRAEKDGDGDEEEDVTDGWKPTPSSIRSTAGRRSRTPRKGEPLEGGNAGANGSRGLNRLEVPPKTSQVDQNAAPLRGFQLSEARRFQRSRSLGPEAPRPSALKRSQSRRSLEEAAAGKGYRSREVERGARACAKAKRGPISAWRKRRKRKKGLRRVGVAGARQSGFRNPFFSTSSLDRIPPDFS